MKIIIRKLRGISLVETIIYVAIFALIFLSVMEFVILTTQSSKSAEERKLLEKQKIMIIEHINDSFSKSTSINTANSIFNNSNGRVRLIKTDGNYIEYSLFTSKLLVNPQNSATNYISGNEFSITNFYLEEVKDSTNTTIGIRANINLASNKTSSISGSIQTMFTIK